MNKQSAQFATSQYQREEFTMVEYHATPVEHSSEETPRGTSCPYARLRVDAGSRSLTGSSAHPADTPSVLELV